MKGLSSHTTTHTLQTNNIRVQATPPPPPESTTLGGVGNHFQKPKRMHMSARCENKGNHKRRQASSQVPDHWGLEKNYLRSGFKCGAAWPVYASMVRALIAAVLVVSCARLGVSTMCAAGRSILPSALHPPRPSQLPSSGRQAPRTTPWPRA